MPDSKDLGHRIQVARKRKGITQQQLANSLGLATGTVQQYELGKRTPKNETIKLIANCLEITPFDLLGPEWFDIQDEPERLSKLRDSITQFQALEQYLKSLGYQIAFEGAANTDDPDIVLIRESKKTVFTGDQFKKFEKGIADSIEYQLWQQRKKE